MAEPFLSFDISAVDLVLMIAVIVLLVLFITQKRGQVAAESHLAVQNAEEVPEQRETTEPFTRDDSFPQESTGFQKCIHHFGYLKNLPKNTPVPDECFGCPKVMRCLFPNEQAQQIGLR